MENLAQTISHENLLKHLAIVGQRIASTQAGSAALEDFRDLYASIRQGDDAGAALSHFIKQHRKVEPNMLGLLLYAATTGLAPGGGWVITDGDLIYQGIQD